ncbi:hypothetical protein [Porphyromonas sp.]|uniref:hypothetical protein n=1 Tax=Porphyromonas sp. TaxID=1924944 RepID=UPI0026DAA79A|nr:hypothetical protein [Porphyromonas sp.]MDO4771195.1 hypothetical protein [Porphyromonas sp.]
MRTTRILSSILNPSLLWMALLPLILCSDGVCDAPGVSAHIVSGVLLILFAIVQSLFRINYRSLYAHLPLLLLIPFHKVALTRIMVDMMGMSRDYSTPLLFVLIIVAALWGISSVRTCELSKHPTCRELLFSNRLMGILAVTYLFARIALPQYAWMEVHLPFALVTLVWVTHCARIIMRDKKVSETDDDTLSGCRQEVRIAIVRGQEIWLTPHPAADCAEKKSYDLPYSTFLRKEENRQAAVQRLEKSLPKGMHPKFLLRYNSDDNDGGHVVYLYVVNIGTECPAPKVGVGGEFWCNRKITEEMNSGRLSSVFKEEYQYLKHTILLANSIVSKRRCDT